jgi:hypothetical protein
MTQEVLARAITCLITLAFYEAKVFTEISIIRFSLVS